MIRKIKEKSNNFNLNYVKIGLDCSDGRAAVKGVNQSCFEVSMSPVPLVFHYMPQMYSLFTKQATLG